MTSLWFESALLPGGWASGVRITARNGLIDAITSGAEPLAEDERHAVGIAGLPNLHSHAFQRGIAGLTERRGATGDSFWTWRELMYQFVERLDPDMLEALAALAYAEMLEAGFTQVGEFHYVHHDRGGAAYANPAELAGRIAAAASHAGIGLTLLPTLYAHSAFGGADLNPHQQRFRNDRDSFTTIVQESRRIVEALPGGVVGIAPHSLRAVTPEELTWLVELAAGNVIHIHIAEQIQEVDACLAWSGLRPVQWLLQNAPVDERWCLVHATHVTEEEVRGMAASGAVIGLCPITEANLGDGIFPARSLLDQTGQFGVGSDSNVLIDAAEELRLLEYSQRLALRGRNVLASGPGRSTGRSLYDGALAGGSRALQCPGGLVSGTSLDIVSLDTRQPQLLQRQGDQLLDSWIFAGGRRLVDCVWRAGRKVVAGGRHLQRDDINTRYRAALYKLLA